MNESAPTPLPAVSSLVPKVRLFSRAHSPEAYAIRDFLSRSEVPFEWLWTTGTGIICDNANYFVTGPDLLTAGHPPAGH